MKAEILAVGTELLIGQIANTNAQTISQELANIGVDVLFHTTVGDNEERIALALGAAMQRSDVVVITGGLGPTHDDLTREAIARVTGKSLERNSSIESWLHELFTSRGREMADANLRQADVPAGAETIDNPIGTAPGIFMEHEGKVIVAVPGVPAEMKRMLEETVLDKLSERAGGSILVSRTLKVAGLGESDLAQRIEATIKKLDDSDTAKIALLASVGEVRIRISAKGADRGEAVQHIAPVEKELRETLGTRVFGADDDTLEAVVTEMLKQRRLTLGVAESFTGGYLVSRLIGVPGVSDPFQAAYVTYSNESKIRDLSVPAETIDKHGAVSEETALAMAEGIRSRGSADMGLSTTGEAGPEPEEQPVGTFWVGLAWEGGSLARRFFAPGERDAVRWWGSQAALNTLRMWMLGELAKK